MICYKIPPIILSCLALWLLKDKDSDGWAVAVALERHPPALRVFRALFEVSLVLLGAALSIHVWTRAVGKTVVGQLLFRAPARIEDKRFGRYQRLSQQDHQEHGIHEFRDDNDNHDDDDDDDDDDTNNILKRTNLRNSGTATFDSELMDADYASDGEVKEGQADDESDSEALPPTPLEILENAIDLLLWVLIGLFLFTVSSAGGGRYIQGMHGPNESQVMASIAAPLFPLLLFVGALIKSVFPWSKRKSFWIILFTTVGAPFCEVTFRDGFVGDVLTSSVRPLQDIAFTAFYLLAGLQGWWTETYDLDDAALPVERSWIVRTVVLPACMVSPLWWRFNQNLRQVWDAKRRWPYLGNAFKYLAAAEVAMFGVFDPTRRTSPIWLVCASLATLYQVWWDVCMDWELIRLERRTNGVTMRLRDQRLYESKAFYWSILIVNIILRFGWTMTFLPKRFLDRTGALRSTFEGLFVYIDPLLASAEILRRTLWGFIRLELEALKSHSDDPKVKERLRECSHHHDVTGDLELPSVERPHIIAPPAFDGRDMKFNFSNNVGDKGRAHMIMELSLWAGVFLAGGAIAAAHRRTY